MDVGGVVVGQDLATASCGLFNAGYFAGYWWRRTASRARRLGAAALTLLALAAVAEAALSQALFWGDARVLALGQGEPGLWALARLPLFIATLLVTTIIIRRMRE